MAEAGDVAGDLEFVGRGDDDDAIDAAAPVGEDAFRFAAGAGVAHHFKDQRRFDDGDGGGIAREDLVPSTRRWASMTAGWTMAFSSLSRPP